MLLFLCGEMMKKLLIFILLLFIPFVSVNALTYPEIYSSKVLVYNLTDDEMLYEKDTDVQTSVASLTKIMTVYTAIDNSTDLEKKITLTREMLTGIPSDLYVVGLHAGETYTIRELCYAAMIASGADATYALAYSVSGSLSSFVNLMNEEAKKIGMTNTHYVNVHGLDAYGHYSSAKDTYLLLKYALNNENFIDIYYKQKYQLNDNLEVKRWYNNKLKTNGINPKNLLGGKTGLTDAAGVCFAALYKSDNHEFIIIILNAPDVKNESYHIDDLISLMKFIDDNYNYYSIFKKGDYLGSIDTFLSTDDLYKVTVPKDVKLFLPSDYDHNGAYFNTNFIKELAYGSLKGRYIGSVTYYYEGEKISEESLYLNETLDLDIVKFIDYYTDDVVLIICLLTLIALIFIVRYFRPMMLNKKKNTKKGSL